MKFMEFNIAQNLR